MKLCPDCNVELEHSWHCSNPDCPKYQPILWDENLTDMLAALWRQYDVDHGDYDGNALGHALASETVASLRRIEGLLEALVLHQIKEQHGN